VRRSRAYRQVGVAALSVRRAADTALGFGEEEGALFDDVVAASSPCAPPPARPGGTEHMARAVLFVI
jgi:hypothetical protein